MGKTASRPAAKGHRLLGETLVAEGAITRSELESALQYKLRHGIMLGQALVALDLVSPDELARALRSQARIPSIRLVPSIIDASVAESLGEEASRRCRAIAVNEIGGFTTIAMQDPADAVVTEEIGSRLGTRLVCVHADEREIERCLTFVFESARAGAAGSREESEPSEETAIELVDGILADARSSGATEIHLEPRRNRSVVRFRLDGTLRDRLSLPQLSARACLARLRRLLFVTADASDRASEASGPVEIGGDPVVVRLSTAPSLYGETAVVVLHGVHDGWPDLAASGLEEGRLAVVDEILAVPVGLTLVVATEAEARLEMLHALLGRIGTRGRKVIALEERVGRPLEGVTQIAARAETDADKARAIRDAERLAPDVLAIDEIRNGQAARAATEAALSGRRVLAGISASDAVEGIARLGELGAGPHLIADALRGVLVLRRLRRLCTACRRIEPADRALLGRLGILGDESPFFAQVGCEACEESGWAGACPLFEVVAADARVAELVRHGAGAADLRQCVRALGARSLLEDGLDAARRGETSLLEVASSLPRR